VPLVAPRPSRMAAVAVPVASTVANIASYALLLAAAHLMTSADYGKLSSLLGLLLIATIPMLALQTVTARRTAAGDGLLGIVRGTSVLALSCAVGLAVLSPALAVFLHLPSVLGVLLVAATIPATAVLGTAMGVAQGRRHFRRLAVLVFFSTAGRSVGGLVALFIHHTANATLLGVVTGTAVTAVVVAVRAGGGLAGHRLAIRDRVRRGVVIESLHAAHAHGVFLLLTSLDVLQARHVLPATAAGVYAVGSVITRASVWLPQSIVLLMFASLAEQTHHRASARRAALVVAGIGALMVGGTAAMGPLIITVVGGQRYAELNGAAWLFALLGALLALLQLAVMAGLAQRRIRRSALLWLTIAADVTVVLAISGRATPTRLVVALVSVTSAAAVAAVAITVRQPVAPDGQGGDTNAGSSPSPNLPATPTGTG
jgi:O-antigen/teichoic acid export membrane protein